MLAHPTDTNPETGQAWCGSFPAVTVRDTVRLHQKMLQEGLGVNQVACVVVSRAFCFPRPTLAHPWSRRLVRRRRTFICTKMMLRAHETQGGSLGGMQALEWLLLGDYVRAGVPIACGEWRSAVASTSPFWCPSNAS